MYNADGVKRQAMYTIAGTTKKMDYCGNMVYTDGVMTQVVNEQGYATFSGTNPIYHYYLKDHLGNNRVVVSSSGATEQTTHYYAFGGIFGDAGTNADLQRYKYNGKELDRMSAIDLYDYGARNYDPALAMWTTQDPMSEKYYSDTPYALCLNNPIRFIDPDGRTIQIYDYINNQRTVYEWRAYQGTWGFYDSNNALYAGNNTFIEQSSGALTGLMSGGSAGFDLVSGLANHSNIVTLMYSNRSGVDSQNQLGWNPTRVRRDGSLESVPTTTGMSNDPMITLGHELGHVDYNWHVGNSTTWFNMTVADKNGNPTQRPISTSEIYATHIENQLRSENNLPLRTYYGVDPSGTGIGPRIIVPSTGASRYYSSQGTTTYKPLRRRVSPYIY